MFLRHVLVGQRPDEARHLLRLREVDAADAGVMQRAAHHLEVEHVGERMSST